MTPADIFGPFLPVVQAFEELGVTYHVGGSVASSFWGVPRSTLDADIVADLHLSHVAPLVERLADSYYVDGEMIRDAIRRRASFNVIHFATMFKIDVFVRKRDPFEDSAFRRARPMPGGESQDQRIVFASPEDTILHKLIWYRMGNQISERQWLDVLGIITVQGTALDSGYLREWAQRLDLTALLDRALREAGGGQV